MNLFLFFCEIISYIGRNIPIIRILIVAFPLNCTFSGDPIQYLQCSVSFRSADCCSPWEMDYVEEEGWERWVDRCHSHHLVVLNIQQCHSTHGPMRFRPNNRIQIDWHTDSRTQAASAHNIQTYWNVASRNEKRFSNWKQCLWKLL